MNNRLADALMRAEYEAMTPQEIAKGKIYYNLVRYFRDEPLEDACLKSMLVMEALEGGGK
jgi:hypothetical protein